MYNVFKENKINFIKPTEAEFNLMKMEIHIRVKTLINRLIQA